MLCVGQGLVSVVVPKLSEALVAASLPVRSAFRHADKDSYVSPPFTVIYMGISVYMYMYMYMYMCIYVYTIYK